MGMRRRRGISKNSLGMLWGYCDAVLLVLFEIENFGFSNFKVLFNTVVYVGEQYLHTESIYSFVKTHILGHKENSLR